MSSSDPLIQATLNRLRERFRNGLVKIADRVSDLPDAMRKEWDLFQDEVIAEADRLEKESSGNMSKDDSSATNQSFDKSQQQIDRLRKKVAEVGQKLDKKS